MSDRSKETRPAYPEFAVRAETFNVYFDKPLPRSTFHDLVNKGKIIPMKDIRGFYLLNESLKRMGLREVSELPNSEKRSLVDIVRFGFSLIDRDVFPEPQWLLDVEIISLRDIDHAKNVAETYRDRIEAMDEIILKLAYFNGVLDIMHIAERDGK